MTSTRTLRRTALLLLLPVLAPISGAARAADDALPPFFDAAVCKPPYSMDSANTLYEAAEKITKPDTSLLTAAVYKMPHEIGQDGFKTREVVFAGSSIGVLVEGQQADALAARYNLTRERSTLFGASTKGYSRALPAAEQPSPDAGVVSIIARESEGLAGKTLLACELVLTEDQAALDAYDKGKAERENKQ
ncbi:hypothetical protein [Sphingomonas alpina]|uniref:hypothetical protein n=1 Tax=Sphingomonas alpina TaxID=653931 RepID=UPI001E2AA8C8|nr:hypothetical protein [Sphingomonas alpina]